MNFVKNRKFAYIFACAVVALGIIFYFVNGVNLSITFTGGTELSYAVEQQVEDTNVIKDEIKSALNKTADVVTASSIGADNEKQESIVVRVGSAEALSPEESKKVDDIVAKYATVQMDKSEKLSIDANIGSEALRNALLAIVFALALIILYIAIRFKQISGWSAGLITTLTIAFDAFVVLAFYVIFKIEINESFIAAILTIIGYSINDKIVIFDRIRENSLGRKKVPFEEIVEGSIKQSLTRTINTSITSLISVVVVLIASLYFNIPAITEFALPMCIGLVFGCASSMFIAAPMFAAYKSKHAKDRK